MSTLLLRLAAPLQSWGVDSKFERRTTGRTPSKSGVIGMCAAALGVRRHEDEMIEKLTRLRFGVRIDQTGTLLKDFHMAHDDSFWGTGDRSKINREKKGSSYLTTRYYLSDAVFLAGLEGDEDLLMEIDMALRNPVFPLYLGRRSCPPEGRVSLGVVSATLQDTLENHPQISKIQQKNITSQGRMRVVIDSDISSGDNAHRSTYLVHDTPKSFNPEHRKYDSRSVFEFVTAIPVTTKEHDAIAAVEEVSPCT